DSTTEQRDGVSRVVAVERRAGTGLESLTRAMLAPDEHHGTVRCARSAPALPRVWVELATGDWVEPVWPRGDCGPRDDGFAPVRRMPCREVARQVVGEAVPLLPASTMTSLGDLRCPGASSGGQFEYVGPGIPEAEVVEAAIRTMAHGSPLFEPQWRDARP